MHLRFIVVRSLSRPSCNVRSRSSQFSDLCHSSLWNSFGPVLNLPRCLFVVSFCLIRFNPRPDLVVTFANHSMRSVCFRMTLVEAVFVKVITNPIRFKVRPSIFRWITEHSDPLNEVICFSPDAVRHILTNILCRRSLAPRRKVLRHCCTCNPRHAFCHPSFGFP